MSSGPAIQSAVAGRLLHHCPPSGDLLQEVGAREGLRWIRFGVLNLCQDERFDASSDNDEVVLVIIRGRCSIHAADCRWSPLGERRDVFSGGPTAVYVPPETAYSIAGVNGATEIAICRAAARSERTASQPRLIRSNEMHTELRGARHWSRKITDVIDENFEADRIIIVEVITPPGHWSSFPPHRHEVDDPPAEVAMEEVYYYRLDHSAGFGLQAVYTDDGEFNDAYIVRDNDVLVIPREYHPVAAAPSSSLYYLCVLAGDRRIMAPRDEPANAWFRITERINEAIDRAREVEGSRLS